MHMRDIIQDALDDLASNKSSTSRQGRALVTLERLLAEICVTADASSTDALQSFVSLQDTFHCNVPFRLLSWISNSLSRLSSLTSKSSTTKDHELELTTLSSQIAQALSIIQGTALIHNGSKHYLGRRYPLEVSGMLVLVELFYSARRVPPVPTSVSTNLSAPSPTSSDTKSSKDNTATSIPLANIVLDTLLCILVDAPSALRVFEDVNGVHTLIKMFKRAATPREVRMRCIEFLYFYLMDESPLGRPDEDSQYKARSHSSSLSSTSSVQQTPTAPSSPVHSSSHQQSHRSALSVSQLSDSSVSSVDSCTTTSTAASNSTRATSVSSRRSSVSTGSTPAPISPLAPSPTIVEKPRHARSGSAQPRTVSMLKYEGEFRLLRPKNAQAKLGVGTPRLPSSRPKLARIDNTVLSPDDTEHEDSGNSTSSLNTRLEELQTPRQIVQRTQAMSLGQLGAPSTPNASAQRGHRRAQSSIEIGSVLSSPMMRSPTASPGGSKESSKVLSPAKSGVRTMQEKKAFLGTMLGNVDALVESIQKAGVLGLA
ncbi:cell division control protein 14, SIN component-domain-containing protein [Cytidiella melzeri]|nr:cell division control protein 14, SIN component-domain-containing protein [Cytidiella melzeri]